MMRSNKKSRLTVLCPLMSQQCQSLQTHTPIGDGVRTRGKITEKDTSTRARGGHQEDRGAPEWLLPSSPREGASRRRRRRPLRECQSARGYPSLLGSLYRHLLPPGSTTTAFVVKKICDSLTEEGTRQSSVPRLLERLIASAEWKRPTSTTKLRCASSPSPLSQNGLTTRTRPAIPPFHASNVPP